MSTGGLRAVARSSSPPSFAHAQPYGRFTADVISASHSSASCCAAGPFGAALNGAALTTDNGLLTNDHQTAACHATRLMVRCPAAGGRSRGAMKRFIIEFTTDG